MLLGASELAVQRRVGRVVTILGNLSHKLEIAGRIEADQCFFALHQERAAKSTRPSDEGLFTTKAIYFLSSQEGLVTRLRESYVTYYMCSDPVKFCVRVW